MARALSSKPDEQIMLFLALSATSIAHNLHTRVYEGNV